MTLAGDALVRFSDALYLIFKLAVVLWQSFDHDIRSVRRVQGTYKEQTLTDLKFRLGITWLAETLKSYSIRTVMGDDHAKGWLRSELARHAPTAMDGSTFHLEVLPLFSSGRARLLANSPPNP